MTRNLHQPMLGKEYEWKEASWGEAVSFGGVPYCSITYLVLVHQPQSDSRPRLPYNPVPPPKPSPSCLGEGGTLPPLLPFGGGRHSTQQPSCRGVFNFPHSQRQGVDQGGHN